MSGYCSDGSGSKPFFECEVRRHGDTRTPRELHDGSATTQDEQKASERRRTEYVGLITALTASGRATGSLCVRLLDESGATTSPFRRLADALSGLARPL